MQQRASLRATSPSKGRRLFFSVRSLFFLGIGFCYVIMGLVEKRAYSGLRICLHLAESTPRGYTTATYCDEEGGAAQTDCWEHSIRHSQQFLV